MFPVSLIGDVRFPVQSAKFPVSIIREFGRNALNLFANAQAVAIGSWDILTIWKQIQRDLESPVNAYLGGEIEVDSRCHCTPDGRVDN